MNIWGIVKPISTPLQPHYNLCKTTDYQLANATSYRSIIGALQYLTTTCPDLTYAVNLVCQQMQPSFSNLQAVKCILRYVKGTINFEIRILSYSFMHLYGFSDADWEGCSDTRRFTTSYYMFISSNCVLWSAKK